VSFNRFILSFIFTAVLSAQRGPVTGELSFSGQIESNGSTRLDTLYVELYDPQAHVVVERTPVSSDGSFRLDEGSSNSSYTIRVVTGPGEIPLVEEQRPVGLGNSLVLRLPDQKTNQPPTGSVSVHQLQHPIPKRAIRAVMEGQRYSEAHDTAKAIEKLEQAIRIAPAFREAHANLGAQYARAGRWDEAVGQFQVALDIGPPDALICSNLALALFTLKQYREGEELARRAVALAPDNVMAQRLLRYAAVHSQRGTGAAQ
jgi:tetratricopeptide (TPR) repeat protein